MKSKAVADMQESSELSIWEYSAIIFAVVLISKLVSKKTRTVDVLWLIVAGAALTNIGLLPKHNEFLETIGEWGIVFIMFALGLEEDLGRFSQGLKRSIGIALIGAAFPFMAGYGTASLFGAPSTPALSLNANAIVDEGSGAPHANEQPFLPISFIIALVGAFPPRN